MSANRVCTWNQFIRCYRDKYCSSRKLSRVSSSCDVSSTICLVFAGEMGTTCSIATQLLHPRQDPYASAASSTLIVTLLVYHILILNPFIQTLTLLRLLVPISTFCDAYFLAVTLCFATRLWGSTGSWECHLPVETFSHLTFGVGLSQVV